MNNSREGTSEGLLQGNDGSTHIALSAKKAFPHVSGKVQSRFAPLLEMLACLRIVLTQSRFAPLLEMLACLRIVLTQSRFTPLLEMLACFTHCPAQSRFAPLLEMLDLKIVVFSMVNKALKFIRKLFVKLRGKSLISGHSHI